MSKSLKDQLLALGLASKQAETSRKKPRGNDSGVKSKNKKSSEMSLDQAYRMRIREERRQKEQSLALKREEERQRRQTNQKIQAIINEYAVRDAAADCKRNFIYKGRIRSVLATREQIRDINEGLLGVVYLSGNYHLMSAARIDEIRQFAADHIPDLRGAETAGEEDNPVPDDLIW